MTWSTRTLSEIAEVVGGSTPKTSVAEYWDGDIPWVTPADLSKLEGHFIGTTPRKITSEGLANSGAKLLPAGSVLLSSRAPIGHVAVTTVPMATNQGFKSLIPDKTQIVPKFLYWWLRTNKAKLQQMGNGATFKEVSKAIVSGVRIPLPPLSEQRRIADILDRADNLRAQRRRALDLLRSMESALFNVMFHDFASNRVRLKDIVPAGDRINYGVVQPGSETPGGVPIIRVGDLQGGLVRRTRLKHISAEIESAYSRSRLKGNEILVSCVGSIGEIAVAGPDDIGSNIARAVARVPVADDVERIYFAAQLRSKRVQVYFVSELRTVSQPTLNIKQLSETEVFVASRAMQSEFASRVTNVEALLESQSEALAQLNELFASLQHRAFQGEL